MRERTKFFRWLIAAAVLVVPLQVAARDPADGPDRREPKAKRASECVNCQEAKAWLEWEERLAEARGDTERRSSGECTSHHCGQARAEYRREAEKKCPADYRQIEGARRRAEAARAREDRKR